MTAVLGVLNKHAVAIAADSAVTVQNPLGRKVLNSANKIFMLSKYHPIGIMLYSSASFMGVPWEIIVKLYREEIKDNSFSTVSDYANDFLVFLKNKNYFSDNQTNLKYLGGIINRIFDDISKIALSSNGGSITDENKVSFIYYFVKKRDELKGIFSKLETCDNFVDYDLESFKAYSKETFDAIFDGYIFKNLKEFELPDDFRPALEETIYTIIKAKETALGYTGLIFVGYGEDEIYPSIIPINVSIVVENRLRYFFDKNKSDSITEQNTASICSFAQTDVIDTILTGIDPGLEEIFNRNFIDTIKKYNSLLSDVIRPDNPDLAKSIDDLDCELLANEFRDLNQEIKRKHYIGPLVETVATLSKEDLAEMVESLI